MILLVHWHPRMKWTVPQYGRTEGTVRVTENNTVNVTHIYGRWKCRSPRNYCKDIVSPHSCFTVLLLKFTLLHDQFHGLSPWRHAFTAALKSGGAAGATHVQISWISAWIPSEVTRTFFFDLPIWDSNSSPFLCRSSSSQREPTVVGSIKYSSIANSKLLCWYTNVDSLRNKLPELTKIINSADNPPAMIAVREARPKTARFNLTPAELCSVPVVHRMFAYILW